MKPKSIFWGVFFILASVFVIVSGFGVFAGGGIGVWTMLATAALLAIALKSIPARNFSGILLPVAIGYKLYEAPLDLPHISWWLIIGAAILMSIGLQILFRRKPDYNWDYSSREWGTINGVWEGSDEENLHTVDSSEDYVVMEGEGPVQSPSQPHLKAENGGDDNHPFASVKLGAASKYIYGGAVETGYFKTKLGAMEIYFDSATLHPDGADIFIDTSLGGTTLYIPRTWRIKPEMNVVIGGVDESPRDKNAIDPNSPVLRIKGNLNLGGLEIKYV